MTLKPTYAICRCERLRTWSDVIEASRHNARDQHLPSTMAGRPGPMELIDRGHLTTAAYGKKILAQHKITPTDKQVVAVEYLLTASPEWFAGRDRQSLGEWVECSMAFIRKRHPNGVLSAQLHLDESTPHLHVVCLPLYEDIVRKRGARPRTPEAIERRAMEEATSPKVWRLSYDRVMGGGRYAFRDLQDQYHSFVGHLGLARGEDTVGKNKRHVPLAEYRKQLQKREQELDHIGHEQELRREALDRAAAELQFRVNEHLRAVDLLEAEFRAVQEQKDRLSVLISSARRRAADLEEREREVSISEARNKARQSELDHIEAEIAARTTRVDDARNELTKQQSDLDTAAGDIASQRRLLDREMQENAARLTLLERHLSDRADPPRSTAELAATEQEKRSATQPWPAVLERLRQIAMRTVAARRRLASLVGRLRKRLRDVMKREAAVEARDRAVAARERFATTEIEKASAIRQAAVEARHSAEAMAQNARRDHARVNEAQKAAEVLQRALAARQADVEKRELALRVASEHLKTRQAQLDADAVKIGKDRRAVEEQQQKNTDEAQRLTAERRDLETESTANFSRLVALNEKEAELQARGDQLSARNSRQKIEQIFLSELHDGQHRVAEHGDKLQILTPTGFWPLLIDGHPLSATSEKACRAIIELQAKDRAADEFVRSLREVAAELKTLQPELRAQVEAQEKTLAALEMRRRSQALAAAATGLPK